MDFKIRGICIFNPATWGFLINPLIPWEAGTYKVSGNYKKKKTLKSTTESIKR